MTKTSNLPRDLAEEVLCRIPLTSLRSVRSTCKKWNTFSKGLSFAKKHLGQAKLAAAAREREFMVVVMIDLRVYLMSINLHNNDVESCIKPQGKLITLDDDISQVIHCDGLLLCITKCNTTLTVWNPYWGLMRRLESTHNFQYSYSYGLGYDKISKSYKILMFIDLMLPEIVEFRIYDFNSDSWRVLDVTPDDWRVACRNLGVSIKGNTYWFASEKYSKTRGTDDSFLVCFDFTSETFGPRLPVPFEFYESQDALSLSVVREEQLAVLYQPWDSLQMEIWVTTKIEPNAVSWNSKVFLEANIKQLIGPRFQFTRANFFIDEEKKVAVVLDKDKNIHCPTPNNRAYIFGVDGSLKEVDLGECENKNCYPRVSSYVPSLVQLN